MGVHVDIKEPKRRGRAKPVAMPETSSAVDIAMATAASGRPLPDIARRLLEEQSDLIHAQTAELKLRHVGNSVRAVLWGVLAILSLVVLVLIGALLVRAARSDSLVVESFRVPPAMAARGLSGEVVATQVLDQLATLQAKTESARAASSYANNWGNDLKIDIPNTGATAEQIWKLLRGWLGKETRISGEVIETPEGLALTARVGGEAGARFVDKGDNLDALVEQGASHIFKKTQPYRYAIRQAFPGGNIAEGEAMLVTLTGDPSEIERKWAYSGLSVVRRLQGRLPEAIAMAKRALEIDPTMIPAIGNLGIAEDLLGHDQRALDLGLQQERDKGGKEYDARIVRANQCSTLLRRGRYLQDGALLVESRTCFETVGVADGRFYVGVPLGLMRHDDAALDALINSHTYREKSEQAELAAERLEIAIQRGDRAAIDRQLQVLVRASDAAVVAKGQPAVVARDRIYRPLEARALAALGRGDDAARVAATTPADCYQCVRARGVAAMAQGRSNMAQRWFAEGVRQGPRLPTAYYEWGLLLAKARRFEEAEAKFAEAVRLSNNHWPDALKAWGDSLAARGKRAAAREKYDAARKLAPRWQALAAARARLA